jgi:DNA mismatch repair protein MutL
MASRIRVLSEDTVNKIAAGEVIENPASVVKELVENSIDAAATEITIEIREGGRQLIRITDNGIGMNSDDALLCLERHATSKLKAVDDLEEISTMGFRGEAVPSVASISKFTLMTRQNENEAVDQPGTMVIVDGGKIVKCSPVECAKGTTIEVKSLFFNVPVRRKFQKSPVYDAAEICRVTSLLALAHPEIKFQLINNQELVLSAPSYAAGDFQTKLEERVGKVLGKEFSLGLTTLYGEEKGYVLKGLLGLPDSAKSNRTGQYLFINRRAVVSPLISYAIRDGYGTMLATGRHPVFVLHLEMPGDFVDVNVHPQKREVRIRQEQKLKDLIIHSVGDSLQRSKFQMEKPSVSFRMPSNSFQESNFKNDIVPLQYSPFFGSEVNLFAAPPDEVFEMPPLPPLPSPIPSLPQELPKELFTPISTHPKVILKAIGAIPGYVIATSDDNHLELILIDQKAAHCRIIYEKVLSQEHQHGNELQMLLIPHTFDLPNAEANFLREQLPLLNRSGIQIKEFGPRTFIIDALPQYFGNVDINKLVEEILHNLHDRNGESLIELERQKKIALSASYAAVSRERRLSLLESQALLDRLFSCQTPELCPNGKPTILKLTPKQIGAMF